MVKDLGVASNRKAAHPQSLRPWLLVALGLCCACGAPDAGPSAGGPDPIVVLLPREPQELDPRFAGDLYGVKVSRLLFASLVRIDPSSLEAIPDLAVSVEIVSPRHYRVVLRQGLRFSDGTPLAAKDVAATYRGVVAPGFGSRYASTYRRIQRIETPSPHVVDFYLDGPHATFITDLELPVMRAQDGQRHVGAVGAAPTVGAGPYVLAERAPGKLELAANPHWHGGRPREPRVTLRVIRDDNTRALRMLAGSGDLILDAIPPLLLPLFEADPRFRVRSVAGVSTAYLGMQTTAPGLSDRRVRRAIALAIDRARIIEHKLGRRAELAQSPIPPGHWAAGRAPARDVFDPAGARRLLGDAGYGEGHRLSLTLRCGSDRFRVSMARAIAAMLARVGIDARVRPSEIATLIADLNRGRFELTLLQLPEVIEPHVLSWFFASDRIPGPGVEGANRWRFESQALDAALERGRRSVERSERVAAYAEVQRILADELPVIPLWHEHVVQVASARAGALPAARNARLDALAR